MKIPKYIVIVEYSSASLRQRVHIGEDYRPVSRMMLIYDEQELDKRMSKAWKPHASAKVYSVNHKVEGSFKSSMKQKGIWA